ncbi:GNAT family N-acetyltransferase [Legionella shakespearei]|uniref:Putative Acetyltransferase, GNAT family n=1 Tax=Legionella shakespearei DSM 23087 TaxID=1122169 RepID=A0A0W0Z7D7_9GAMM|nr:GNAT family N-acetyltransferase [Legionella shakespearei]KTD65029.1 putative Acetyltransferase, GNAT family [Legionella shakespearei DSM 23087]
MLITKALAARMEACIKQTHIEVTRQYSHGTLLEINGGAACFSGFDSFLSQVVGWGFATKAKEMKAEIERIEHFYHSLNHKRVDIELCPYTGQQLGAFLSQRGYKISELNNISALDVTKWQWIELDEEQFTIQKISPDEFTEWSKRIAKGFGYPEAQEQFFHYINARGSSAFAVYDNGQIVAGATIAMHGSVCDLGVTSTLPLYRGKGLQKKLIAARLNFASQNNMEIATVTTEPGSVSDLNVQKAGFRSAYTRIKMTLEQ